MPRGDKNNTLFGEKVLSVGIDLGPEIFFAGDANGGAQIILSESTKKSREGGVGADCVAVKTG
jgi:hypothetical protein